MFISGVSGYRESKFWHFYLCNKRIWSVPKLTCLCMYMVVYTITMNELTSHKSQGGLGMSQEVV